MFFNPNYTWIEGVNNGVTAVGILLLTILVIAITIRLVRK